MLWISLTFTNYNNSISKCAGFCVWNFLHTKGYKNFKKSLRANLKAFYNPKYVCRNFHTGQPADKSNIPRQNCSMKMRLLIWFLSGQTKSLNSEKKLHLLFNKVFIQKNLLLPFLQSHITFSRNISFYQRSKNDLYFIEI